jgi:hypothetical protein
MNQQETHHIKNAILDYISKHNIACDSAKAQELCKELELAKIPIMLKTIGRSKNWYYDGLLELDSLSEDDGWYLSREGRLEID